MGDILVESREILLIELEERFLEFYNFHENNQERLTQDQIKYSDKVRRRIKKIMISLYEGYYPSMGGHSKMRFVFMFKNILDATLFSKEIMKVTKLYKKVTLEELNEINFKVTLHIFESDEEFFKHVDKIVFNKILN